jgi:hypothetical protein
VEISMATNMKEMARSPDIGETLVAVAMGDGGARHPYVAARQFAAPPDAARNLSDAAHYLCTLHGRLPGVIDLTGEKNLLLAAQPWLERAIEGFARERAYLTRLVVAAGPLPSTPGQAETEAAVTGQRHALEMLARSDRTGCALGAAMAMVLDWRAVRIVLDAAATRFGVNIPNCILPDVRETVATAVAVGETPSIERAILFGAQQLLIQHRGLWDLLEARQLARRDH